jgi:hypothetical protein
MIVETISAVRMLRRASLRSMRRRVYKRASATIAQNSSAR